MSCPEKTQCYRVAWFVEDSTAMRDMTVRLDGGRRLDVTPGHHEDAVDLGRVAMIPGLVNAHTHLEFSLLREPIPTTGRFTDWIRSVIAYRREHPDVTAEAIRAGSDESLRAGTTLIGDIATEGWSANDYLAGGIPSVVFQELLGLTDERVASQKEVAQRLAAVEDRTADLERRTPHPLPLPSRARGEGTAVAIDPRPADLFPSLNLQPSTLNPAFGLSPHAPYSVRGDLFRSAIELAKRSSRPIAMHLAETEAELELLAHGTGEFREMLTEFGLWRDGLFGDGRRPMDYLAALAECPRSLVVHGNYLTDDELRFVAAHPQMTLVYCPRTHAAFGHREHPWRRLLEQGGSVAIGTDSRASNPDLSVFAELQFLAARHPDISHLSLLRLGSASGRAALGFDSRHSVGANFTVIALSDASGIDPARDLFAAGNRVVGTIIDGHWRFADELSLGRRVSSGLIAIR